MGIFLQRLSLEALERQDLYDPVLSMYCRLWLLLEGERLTSCRKVWVPLVVPVPVLLAEIPFIRVSGASVGKCRLKG